MVYFYSLLAGQEQWLKNKMWSNLENNRGFLDHIIKPELVRIDSMISENILPTIEPKETTTKVNLLKEDVSTFWKDKISKWDSEHNNSERSIVLNKETDIKKHYILTLETNIDKYIEALNKEIALSPNSSNLKTYVKIFGHEAAF